MLHPAIGHSVSRAALIDSTSALHDALIFSTSAAHDALIDGTSAAHDALIDSTSAVHDAGARVVLKRVSSQKGREARRGIDQ